jgi:hypothetical protein
MCCLQFNQQDWLSLSVEECNVRLNNQMASCRSLVGPLDGTLLVLEKEKFIVHCRCFDHSGTLK